MLTRLDDALIDHTKIERAADIIGRFGYQRALGATAWGIVYANRHLTDGFLPQRAIDKYGISKAECAALVTVTLWERAEGGYQIHDFADWNPAAAEVKAKQSHERARKRDAYYRKVSANSPRGENDGEPPDIHADIPHAHGIGLDRSGSPSVVAALGVEPEKGRPDVGLLTARFETFWAAFDRREKRKDALRIFAKLNPDHELLAKMLDSIARWKLSRKWREGFQPLPTTWLNAEGWNDEVPPEPVALAPLRLSAAEHRSAKNAASLAAVIASIEAEEQQHAQLGSGSRRDGDEGTLGAGGDAGGILQRRA